MVGIVGILDWFRSRFGGRPTRLCTIEISRSQLGEDLLNPQLIHKYIQLGYPVVRKLGLDVSFETMSIDVLLKEQETLVNELRNLALEVSPLKAYYAPIVLKLNEHFNENRTLALHLGSLLGEYRQQLNYPHPPESPIRLVDPKMIKIAEAFIDRYLLKTPNIPTLDSIEEGGPLIQLDDDVNEFAME